MLLSFRNLNTNKLGNVTCQIVLKPIVGQWASLHVQKTKKSKRPEQLPVSLDEQNLIPIIKCKRPQFNFYVGQSYRSYKEIPLASKSWHHPQAKGDYIKIRPVMSPTDAEDQVKFTNLPLNKSIVDALSKIGLETAMPIQTKAIPPLIEGLNTMVASETGCGKTLAFLLPMLHHVLNYKGIKDLKFNAPRGVIVTPTRELAKQISDVVERLGHHFGIKVKMITGGNISKVLRNPPVSHIDILVSSIGALKKMTSLNLYELDEVKHIVLDEADVLLSDAFHDKVKSFLQQLPLYGEQNIDEHGLPTRTQLTLTCATVPKNLNESLEDIVDVHNIIRIATENLHYIRVPQDFFRVSPCTKSMKLLEYVKEKIRKKQPVIVFVNSSKTCDFIDLFLKQYNIQCTVLHGDMLWNYRKVRLDEYLQGRSLILITTHIGARGLDTIIVKNVLNYDFPMDTLEYIHRCGRTGRPGTKLEECKVTNFISSEIHVKLLQKIEMAVRKGMPIPLVSYRNKESQEVADDPTFTEDYIPNDFVYDDISEEGSIPY